HRLALDPPAQVPQRGIEAGERAAAVAAGKLVLALLDALDERLDGKGVGAERPGRHLAMEDRGGDVGVVGRGLSPAARAGVRGDAHEAHEPVVPGLEPRNLHGPVRAAGTATARRRAFCAYRARADGRERA